MKNTSMQALCQARAKALVAQMTLEEKIGQMQDFLNSFEEDDSDTEERQE